MGLPSLHWDCILQMILRLPGCWQDRCFFIFRMLNKFASSLPQGGLGKLIHHTYSDWKPTNATQMMSVRVLAHAKRCWWFAVTATLFTRSVATICLRVEQLLKRVFLLFRPGWSSFVWALSVRWLFINWHLSPIVPPRDRIAMVEELVWEAA
jgi:hypothetical protein